MHKRFMLTFTLALGLILTAVTLVTAMSQESRPAAPAAPAAWPGAWQLGPEMNAAIWGGPAGEGFARFSGSFYTATNRIYFLGGRREDNSTTGVVFYFDLATRTYAATGATMPTPVSNYFISQFDDGAGHGIGLYIVGGRNNAGVQINDVQVYYPDDNTVATIATDPLPASPARLVGGQAFVNGQLYVLGGFDGTTMFDETYVYSPTAPAGARWTDTGCDLPTPRAYIATAVVGNKIYAIGGDELPALTPINDTIVLDTDNLGACWQDAAMADLPSANGDAPAVYVDEGFLGGGIYTIGGGWPSPGPYRWVFRYDIAADAWEDFPQLAVPDPATGRRNQAAVYVPASAGAILGLGNGVPGIWTFGGYDGSDANAMTNSSEYFSIEAGPVLVLPEQTEVSGVAGGSVTHGFILVNQSGSADTFDLGVTADVTWTATLPASIGPVANGEQVTFSMGIDLPFDATCPATGIFTVTATAQSSPVISDSQAVSARIVCGVGGVVRDATTGDPLENAYVWIQNTPDGLDAYYDAFTNVNGEYILADVPPDTYYLGASARYFQPSFYPTGWPTGAITLTVAGNSTLVDLDLVGSRLEWTPNGLSVSLPAGGQLAETLVLTNSGTGPLVFAISELASDVASPPPALQVNSQPPRIDPQLYTDLAAAPDGKTEFLVVLQDQANLDAAYGIADWEARGQYVVDTLQAHAATSQRGLNSLLAAAGVSYRSLYIINALIVKDGDLSLINTLAARPDVAYLQANYRIPVEHQPMEQFSLLNGLFNPTAIEWNIQKVNADDVWGLGYNGQGIVVAEIDTGTQWDHPALKPHYRGWDGATADHNYNWYDPYNQSPDVPADEGAHGTHVMGTMVGDDGSANQIGMAPGAKWISCKGGDDISGYLLTNELLLCAEWIVAPWDLNGQNPDPAMRPHVVNNSWGGGPNDYWYTGAVSAWRAAGIFPAFANGNAGPGCSTAHSPGDNWNTFAAGATDSTDAIASFSSRGPAEYTGILKPDISAPGVAIRSSVPTNSYASFQGTSMASPHVAGAVALLWSAAPDLIGQIDTTGWVLQQNAFPLYTSEGCGGDGPTDLPNNTFGYGRLDILAAVNAAMNDAYTLPWLNVDPSGGVLLPGATESATNVSVTFDAPSAPGAYTGTLWLVADDPYNHDVRLPVELTVLPSAPTAGFSSSSPDFFGETTTFNNTSYGSEPLSYLWDLGDGVTSTLENPTHVYAELGDYTVALSVTNAMGGDLVTGTVSIVDVPPVAGFTSVAAGEVGEVILFTNTSAGTHLVYLWDFGDGITSTLENPTHTYAVGDIYTVTLQASNSAGSDETHAALDISGPPVAGFASSSPDLLGQTTVFTDTTRANPDVTAWVWNLGDGQFGAGPNPTHQYGETGLYTVTLTAINARGNDEYTDQVAICTAYVDGAGFTADPVAPEAGQTVTFQGSVAAGDEFSERPVQFAWDFGDGGLGAGDTITHVFAAGSYTVTLAASGPCGADDYSAAFNVAAPAPDYSIYLPLVLK